MAPKIKATARAVAADVAGCAGAALIAAGVHAIYPPAALILAGIALVLAALAFSRQAPKP